MAKNKFYTKTGWLTFYALSCGYIHKSECGEQVTVTLAMNNVELNTFDVIRIERGKEFNKRWDVVEGLPAARALYKKLCKPARVQKRWANEPDLKRWVFQ